MAKDRVFAVIGIGAFGRKVCEVLSEKGGKVIAIDNRPKVVESIKEIVTQSVLLDSTDEESLSAVPFESVDVAIVAIGDNIEASILTTALLKQMGISYIVARAVSELHHRVLRQLGADEVINIEIDQGARIAQKLIAPDVLDRIPITESISVAELYAPAGLIGQTLSKLDLRKTAHVNIMAIRRISLNIDASGSASKGEEVLFPGPETVIEDSDVLIALGKNDDLDKLKEL